LLADAARYEKCIYGTLCETERANEKKKVLYCDNELFSSTPLLIIIKKLLFLYSFSAPLQQPSKTFHFVRGNSCLINNFFGGYSMAREKGW